MTTASMNQQGAPNRAAAALATAEACVGAIHRLAWEGPDETGDRRRALGWFRSAVATLGRSDRALAAVLDWWLVSALGEDPVELAWSVDRELPSRLGDVLRAILECDGPRRLDVVRRPAAFQEVLRELELAADRNPGKIVADKHHISDANSECRQVLRAAEVGGKPPQGLRLPTCADDDLETWASEGSGSRKVTPNTPIWDSLVRQLAQRRDLVQRALSLWPRKEDDAPALPDDWRAVLASSCGPGADLAAALVEDALPEPGDRPLLDPATVLRAAETPPGEALRARWFVLVREAVGSSYGGWPGWARQLADQLDALSTRIDAHTALYEGDAADALEAARQALVELNPEDAEAWLGQATEMHREAVVGANHQRLRERAEERCRVLRAVGVSAPDEAEDLAAWAEAVETVWRDTRQSMLDDVAALERRLSRLRGENVDLRTNLGRASRAAQRGELAEARASLDASKDTLEGLVAAVRKQLGEALWAVFDAAEARDPALRRAVDEAIQRTVARREAGLDVGTSVRDLRALVSDPSRAASIAVGQRRIAFVLAGVEAGGFDPSSGVSVCGFKVTAGNPDDAPTRVAQWGEVWTLPRAESLGSVYLRNAGSIVGPYRLDQTALVPADERMAVARLAASRFDQLFGRVAAEDGRWLVPMPPTLDELLAVGADAEDLLDDEALARWLASEVADAPPVEGLRRWLAHAEHQPLPLALREARLARLGDLVARAEALAPVRAEAVAEWLASDEGAAAAARAAEALVDRDAESYRRRFAERRAALDRELADAEDRLATVHQRIADEEQNARRALDEVQAKLTAAEELLADHKLKLLAEISGVGGGAQTASMGPAGEPPVPIRAGPFEPTAVPDLPSLVREVAGHTWDELEVANLLLSVATGRWTLLAGLPGVGKSTFVRSVLARLGHGPTTERYLELVVRRDWQDDAALFGFWHPTDRRWVSSSEGFVEHLLRARDGMHGDGFWPVLVEELNLASPEYYLARMLSAFEAATPTVRLYDPELGPLNAERYPNAFAVPPAVRVLGTVNVDDTVERLSPRFLSRLSVIWIEPSLDPPRWRAEDDETDLSVPWSALVAAGEHEEADLGPITELVRLLQDQRVPGAPTARTRRAIGRYLAASRGVMPTDEAMDLQVLQRVLPPLRGTGPRWRRLLDRMGELLERNGWRRSAARTRELRERGEELGDWYDFFHT